MPTATATWMPIGELSSRLGVSPDLLRKWERRYGVLKPTRTPGNHRLYSRVDQARVQLMLRHLAQGLPAAQAAQMAIAAGFKEAPGTGAAVIEHAVVTATNTASFETTLIPMLVADDQRRYVDVNQAVEPGRHLSLLYFPASNANLRSSVRKASGLAALTEREREVLTLIAGGERGASIAAALGVSQATVETHVRRCLVKLGARNRAHAIALGLQRGEIMIRLGAPRSNE